MSAEGWVVANRRHLDASCALLRARLERADVAGAERALAEADDSAAAPPALARLAAAFGLTPFERDLLLLCAAPELDASFGDALAAHASATARQPTLRLAIDVLGAATPRAATPLGPLRYWRLVEPPAGASLMLSPLRIDEWALHHLLGHGVLDERLEPYVERIEPVAAAAAPSQEALVRRVADVVDGGGAIQVCGRHAAPRRAVAAAACAATARPLFALAADALTSAPPERDSFRRLWEREAAMAGAVLLVECDEVEDAGPAHRAAAARFLNRLRGPLVVSTREPLPMLERDAVRIDVSKPGRGEQEELWRTALGPAAASLDGTVGEIAAQFDLDAAAIAATARSEASSGSGDDLRRRLWDACRARSRASLDDLAQRVDARASWDDLVLPEPQLDTLRQIVAHVRRRERVYERWGFGASSARGLGISALFVGASGTGKTLAGEVLARELDLDLYRIDLSAVVSKYIGETEKNLRRVFDAAEEGGAVLLFDEADALFGKRSEVRDSHDRYANIEVSYLLQRMEAHRGLAILTTNLKSALDGAFMRRLRFVVQFPFPDALQRAEIWRRIFPAATPSDGLDPARLANLNVTGGSIRNIALNAAFLAADEDRAVGMAHVLRAARAELAKLERPLSQEEVAGWV